MKNNHLQTLEQIFIQNENKAQASKQSAYLRNLFPFYGLTKGCIVDVTKSLVEETCFWSVGELVDFCFLLFKQEQREYQHLAIIILIKNYQRFSYQNIQSLYPLIDTKSWWDSVDGLQKPFSLWTKNHQQYLPDILSAWNSEPSIWKRRSAIILQLLWKSQLNKELLAEIILSNIDDKEFFIQKAIGWSLRDYSKTNPTWVKEFISRNPLSNLAKREGSKYIY